MHISIHYILHEYNHLAHQDKQLSEQTLQLSAIKIIIEKDDVIKSPTWTSNGQKKCKKNKTFVHL